MIRSMTGYGSAKGETAGFEVSVELKSVNNRYLETSVRLPRSFLFAEDMVKSEVAKRIGRGKVDVFVNITAKEADEVVVSVNHTLAKQYISAIQELSDTYGIPANTSAMDISKIPEILSVERKDVDTDTLNGGICGVLNAALDDYDAMRIREGEKLKQDILSRTETIENFVTEIEKTAPETIQKYKERLEAKIRDVLADKTFDEARVITEVAIFADKVAIDEETVRLRSHIAQMRVMMDTGSPIGKKVDFLVQEFNREANTIGSKCQNSDIAHLVVDLKSEIEKVREQIQNIE